MADDDNVTPLKAWERPEEPEDVITVPIPFARAYVQALEAAAAAGVTMSPTAWEAMKDLRELLDEIDRGPA